jgi:hypothetical protein
MVKKYGQTVLVTQDLALENYLNKWVGVTRIHLALNVPQDPFTSRK